MFKGVYLLNGTKNISFSFYIYEGLIRDIKLLLQLEWTCSLHHVLREGNQATNFLAKLGASSGLGDCVWKRSPKGDSVWKRSPKGLELILTADSAEILRLR